MPTRSIDATTNDRRACRQNSRAGWITVVVMIALTASVRAQEAEIGRTTYLENCAACHGADGRGGGAQGSRLEVKPADLTLLARRNGGVVSSTAVYAAIDGPPKTLRAIATAECRSGDVATMRRPTHGRSHPDRIL